VGLWCRLELCEDLKRITIHMENGTKIAEGDQDQGQVWKWRLRLRTGILIRDWA
jgi:hypothetical protein